MTSEERLRAMAALTEGEDVRCTIVTMRVDQVVELASELLAARERIEAWENAGRMVLSMECVTPYCGMGDEQCYSCKTRDEVSNLLALLPEEGGRE